MTRFNKGNCTRFLHPRFLCWDSRRAVVAPAIPRCCHTDDGNHRGRRPRQSHTPAEEGWVPHTHESLLPAALPHLSAAGLAVIGLGLRALLLWRGLCTKNRRGFGSAACTRSRVDGRVGVDALSL